MNTRSDDLTTEIERDPDKLDAAMPWYVNGSLSDSDKQWVEQQLEQRGRSAGHERLDRGISVALENRAKEVPANIAWDGLLAKVREDQQSSRPAVKPEKQDGALTRFFDSILSPRMGMAMAALLAVQTLTIGYMANERSSQADTVRYRSMGTAKPVPVIRAVFVKSASIDSIRDGLFDRELVIVDGPNQFGEYFLYSPDGRLEETAKGLADDGLIERYVIDSKVMSR